MSSKLKIFSFFSGAGFLDLGFEAEGFRIEFVNEYHRPFMEAYKFSRMKLGIEPPKYGYYLGSIDDLFCPGPFDELTKYVSESREDGSLVGFIGGPPCPDFSVGGKNKGQSGSNGRLSKSYVELIIQQRPDFFLFENVKGLWRTKKHRQFYEEIKSQVIEAGYRVSERLVNAIEYGAPQDRERIILVGFNSSLLNDPEKGIDFEWMEHAIFPDRRAFNYNWADTAPFVADSIVERPDDLPQELCVEYWFRKNDVYNHANSRHVFQPRAGLARFKSVAEGDVGKKSYKRLHRWRYSPTAAYGNNEVHLHPYKARRISIAEALAIQSLPKEFELPPHMTLSNMFKCVGNGVPLLAARCLAKTIKAFLEKQSYGTDSDGARRGDKPIAAKSGI